MLRQRTPFLFKVVVISLLSVSVILGIRLNVVQSQLQTIRTILNDTWDKANHRLMSTAWTGGALANTTFETETTIFNDVWDQPNHLLRTSSGGPGGGGDFSSNTSTSVDGEVVVFSGTGGKFGRRPGTLNGFAFLTNGVLSVASSTGLGDPGAAGYVVRSALNSTVARSLLGTAGNISVTNPTGVAGDSVIDLISTGIGPGSCSNCNLTIDAKGRIMVYTTGTGGSGSPLTIRELDGAPTIGNVTTLQVTNGTLTDNGGGVATLVTGGGGPGAVSSVFGRTGNVVATANDYTETQISFSDITTNNANTSMHGYLRKLPGNASLFLDGTGNFTTPPTGSGSPLNVQEIDGAPSVSNVTTLKVTNGTLTDNGGGVVTLLTGGPGGSGTVSLGTPNASARWNNADTTVGPSTGLTLSATKVLTTYNNVTTIATNTTLDQHNIVNCLAGGATVTATLPLVSAAVVGHYTVVKGDDTGICQVARAGSDTFNGLAGPLQLTKKYDAVIVDAWDPGTPGVWWYTATKAQWGYLQLSMKGADLPSSNAAIIAVDEPRPKLVFNDVTSWCASWTFTMNPDYGVLPQVVYKYTMTSATTGSTKMDWSVWKTTPAQAELAQSPGYDTANTCTDASVNTTPGRESQVTCALSFTDAMAANDEVTIKACRNVTGTGLATGNLNMISAQLQYFKQ